MPKNAGISGRSEQRSIRRTEHGYGKEIIRSICRKYDGEYTLRYADGQAAATVMLRLTPDPAQEPDAP